MMCLLLLPSSRWAYVPVVDAGNNPWMVIINVNTVPVEFKISYNLII